MGASSNVTTTVEPEITTSIEEVTTRLANGLPQIISVTVTIVCLAIILGIIYGVYRLFCSPRSKHHGAEDGGNGKVYFDQFDVNCSQLNIQSEEQQFVNPAAKITSESDSCSSNVSSSTAPASGSVSKLVKSVHGERFAVSKVRERSSRPSSFKMKLPKKFLETTDSTDKDDDQFAIALIDHRSNTIHNIDLSDCVIVNTQANTVITPTSALFAQKWKDKTRYRRARRASVDNRINRNKGIIRQASCPSTMSANGFQSESSSHSDESTPPAPDAPKNAESGVSLSSIDETANNIFSN